jgi:hypothetical protein
VVVRKLGLVLLGTALMVGAVSWVAGAESRPEGENPAARQKPTQAFWAGESGGFKIRWTDRDIQIHPSKSPNLVVFSARSRAKQEFARFVADEKKYGLKERYCEVVSSYKILSVVPSTGGTPVLTNQTYAERGKPDLWKTGRPGARF